MKNYENDKEDIMLIFTEDMIAAEKKHKRKKTSGKFKYISVAAALILTVGIFNIPTVSAFIKEKFFVPGLGLQTDNEPIEFYVSDLDRATTFECDTGIFKLDRAYKINRSGKIIYFFELYSHQLAEEERLAQKYSQEGSYFSTLENYPALKVDYNGEIKEYKGMFDLQTLNGASSTGSLEGGMSAFYSFGEKKRFDSSIQMQCAYIISNVSDFDILKVAIGNSEFVEINFVPESEMILRGSTEAGNIGVAALIMKNDNTRIDYGVYNNHADAEKFLISGTFISLDEFKKIFGEDGNKMISAGGFGYTNYRPNSDISEVVMNKDFLYNPDNIKISKIEAKAVIANYEAKKDKRIKFDMPVPKDGETIEEDIIIPVLGFDVKITEIRRDGDRLYYKMNTAQSEGGYPKGSLINYIGETCSVISDASIGFDIDDKDYYRREGKYSNLRGEGHDTISLIIGVTDEMETIPLYLSRITLIHFGNFEINFDE